MRVTHIFSSMLSVVTLGLGLAPSLLAAPDLTISLSGVPTVSTQGQDKIINFTVNYTNLGDAINTTVRSKAFLIDQNHDYVNVPGLKGIVLPPFDEVLNLAANETSSRQIHLVLPTVAAANYILGAVTDTQSILNEPFDKAMNNTAPDMLSVGQISNTVAETRDLVQAVDIYHEVHTRFDLRNGRASHRSRMVFRGNRDSVSWSNSIYARFLAVDVPGKKLYMSAYNQGTIDKFWSGISWNNEFDKQGRPIYVDYYTNQPLISHLKPGKYLMGPLMNVRDVLPEAFPENNLDLTAFNLNAPVIYSNPEIWLVADNVAQLPTQTLSFMSPVDLSAGQRSYFTSGLPTWLSMTANTGILTSSSSVINSVLTPVGNPAQGEYSATLRMSEVDANAPATLVPVHLFVNGTGHAGLSLSSTSVSFTSQQGIDPEPTTITITNTGTETLKFSLSQQEMWLFLSPSAGQVAPGASVAVQVRAIQYGLRPSSFNSAVTVYSNASNTPTNVSVGYSITTRTTH